MGYNSKYKGNDVEELLDEVVNIKEELDSIGGGSLTNLYKKDEVEINKRVSTSGTSSMDGAMLTNWLDIPMNHGVEHPVLRIKGLPHPETFGTHDYDRFVYKKNGADYKNDSGEWIVTYLKSDPSSYTKEVLDDGTLVLTMLGGGMPNWWGYNIGSEVYQPRICMQDVNGDGSALTEAPDLIITLNEEIEHLGISAVIKDFDKRITQLEEEETSGEGVDFDVIPVTHASQMTDITKLYALNGEVYRYEGEEGVNEVAAVAVAAEGGEIPLFTNLYKKEEAVINTRVSTSATSAMDGAMLTNYMEIPMNSAIENPVVRIQGLPDPEGFGTHDYDRFFCLKDGVEDKTGGKWVVYYMKEGFTSGYYTKEVLEDGTLVLTMKGGGFPAIWGASSSSTYQPRISMQDVNGDGSAITEAPDLIITLNEEIKYGTPEEPSEPTNKGRWVNTHIKYDADASQMILDNLGELQGYAEIPAYWESEMVDTIEKVQRLKKAAGNNAISFAWCSDAHVMVNTSAEGNTTYLGRLLNKAIKDTFTPLAISTGDEMHGAALASEDVVYENFAEMKKHFYPMWGKKEFIALLGNHDGAYGKNDQGGQTYQKRIQPNELFDVYFKEQMLDFRRVVSTDGTYFYIDTPQKVRFICLNTHYAGESVEVDENGFTKVNVYNNNYLGQQQYDWLINEALKLPSDEWTCIVSGHIAPVLGTNLTIPSGSNPAYNYSSSLKDKEVLAGVLNAYIAKSAYTKSYSDANGVGDVSIDCDFSTYKGTIICYIAGHWHCDLTENKSLNGVPIILITSAQDDRDSSLPPRTDGTDQETAFDVVVINRNTRKIHCVRCGAGEDRTIRY